MDVVYLYDAQKRIRKAITSGVSELIHSEEAYQLTAEIPMSARAVPGEYIGLACVDGRYRLFCADETEDDDHQQLTIITATDAAVSELTEKVVENLTQSDKTAREAVAGILNGTGWSLGTVTAGSRTESTEAYYLTAWEALKNIAEAYNVRIVPYYIISGGEITGRRVDVLEKTSVFRGRIFESAADAGSMFIVRSGNPKSVIYATGKATGTSDNPERVTIADAEWSVAGGDPADKPRGQTWVADAGALEAYGRKEMVYKDQYEDDPEKLLEKAWDELQKSKAPKVSGTAVAQDMEMLPGQSHKAVRLWDTVAVAARSGETIETQVIGISRNYIRPWLTKFKLGEEEESIINQVAQMGSDLSSLSSMVSGHGNGIGKNKEYIEIAAEHILLKADKTVVDELATRVNHAEIDINGLNATITLKANQTEVTEIKERVSAAEILIDGANAKIELKASQKEVSAIGERLSEAEASLTVQAGQISTKVSRDGVISSINQTAESIKIQAKKIELSGYVTATQLSSEVASINTSLSQQLVTNTLTASTAYIDRMIFKDDTVLKTTKSFVTGVTFPTFQTRTIYYKNHSGENVSQSVIIAKLSDGSTNKNSNTFLTV